MSEEALYPWLPRGFFALAALTFPALFFITAPYGRHAEQSRFPGIDSTLGWVLMESPSALVPLACWLLGEHRGDPARLSLLALWELHYVHRAYVFPFRRRGGGARKIPHGGLYRFVSCPNYLGEIVEWTGFALAAWSSPAVGFALWTTANLLPRALSHHRWYRDTFPDYPAERKALFPFVL